MAIVFACGAAHAPGIVAWPERAPTDQAERFHRVYRSMRPLLEAAKPDVLVAFTSEHWVNFFLDNMPPFCIGIGESHFGPTEKWLGMAQGKFPGDRALAMEILAGTQEAGFDLAFSEELNFDHGLIVPMMFLTPDKNLPIVPIVVNTVSHPMPLPSRCFDLGAAVGRVAQASGKRIAVMATGGLSHWPGQSRAGTINQPFDIEFLGALERGDAKRLRGYTAAEVALAGGGGEEVRNWIALAGCVQGWRGRTLAYEPVSAWATGCGLAVFEQAA